MVTLLGAVVTVMLMQSYNQVSFPYISYSNLSKTCNETGHLQRMSQSLMGALTMLGITSKLIRRGVGAVNYRGGKITNGNHF